MDLTSIIFVVYVFYLGFLSNFSNAQKSRVTLTIAPADVTVAKLVGENYLVSCRTSDNAPPTWQGPRQSTIEANDLSRVRTEANVGLELYFSDIRKGDAGEYVCSSRGVKAGFNLTVIQPIEFDTSLANQSAKEGHDFLMRCVARGHTANTKISWRIDMKRPSGRFKEQPGGNLLISRVQGSDANQKYLCRAVDVNPSRPNNGEMAVTLKVQTKPKLLGAARKNMYGVDGAWANLTCQVVAFPPARFEWFIGNRRLANSNEILIFNQTENYSVLQALIRRNADFGEYVCKAMNPLGGVDQILSLKRAKKPKTPILQIYGQHLGSTGVAVAVVYPNDPGRYNDPATEGDKRARVEELPVIGYSVQYKMMKKETWITVHNATLTTYGFILRNLHPNVSYFIKAAARNAASTGDYSADLEILTPKNTPFNPPLNIGSTFNSRVEYTIFGVAFINILLVIL